MPQEGCIYESLRVRRRGTGESRFQSELSIRDIGETVIKTPASVRVVNWNLEWATPTSARGKELLRRTRAEIPEVVCFTETTTDILAGDGHTIIAGPDYGYPGSSRRRKVLLWSRSPWTDVDELGAEDLPGGRFVAGTTQTSMGEVRAIGICIPWRDAHVRNGRRDRKPWEDHERFLVGLKSVLETNTTWPLVVLGDFNQRIPRRRAPEPVYERLMDSFSTVAIATAGHPAFGDTPTIDHVATSPGLSLDEVRVLSREHESRPLSDHFGVFVTLQRAKRED